MGTMKKSASAAEAESAKDQDQIAISEVRRARTGGTFPCAAVCIRRAGAAPVRAFFGEEDPETGHPADQGTIFDLASLTKPLATTLLVLKAADRGEIGLDDRTDKYLPEAKGTGGGATVRDLLRHAAGLPAIPALERFFPDPYRPDRNRAMAALFAIEPERRPGESVVYSCTGFLLLGALLERLGGQRLSALFDREIALPLGLNRGAGYASFLPDDEARKRAAPTEFCAWRKRRVVGEVHDESSYCLGGDGGNAGLFADLAGAEKLFAVYETGGGLLSPGIVAEAKRLQTSGLNRKRGLGLQLHDAESFDGPACPEDSYGHTGFTGTSVWNAPSAGISATALTNRVYYGRERTAETMAAFRRAFHTALVSPSSPPAKA